MSWFGSLTVQNKNKLNKITNMASKIIGVRVDSLQQLYEKQIARKTSKIMKDPDHPLAKHFLFLPSNKRLRAFPAKTNRTLNSFVPSAIRLFNS